MSRTLKLLNASGKHVYCIRFRCNAILIMMYTRVCIYMYVNLLYMQIRCLYYICEGINSTDIGFAIN